MKETVDDLSVRYYAAEVACWLLGGVLLVSKFFGIAPDQPLPFLNVMLASGIHYVRAVAALSIAALLYLFFEWHQSPRSQQGIPFSFIRFLASILWIAGSLWCSYPILSQNTRFEGISPVWYLGFAATGFVSGFIISIIIFSVLMIRSPEESKRLRLPRIPVATRAQFFTWTPVLALLLFSYFVLLHFSPSPIHGLSLILFLVPLALMILDELASHFLARDANGDRIPYAKHLGMLKKVFESHDYGYFLNNQNHISNLGVDPSVAAPELQKAIRSKCAQEACAPPINFHVQQQEEVKIGFYAKDGNPNNRNPKNCGVRLYKSGNSGFLGVSVIPDDRSLKALEMNIPVALVEVYADEYLSTHTEEKCLVFREFFSYAINQAVIKVMTNAAGSPLYRAVQAGQIETVRGLIQKKDVAINEMGEFGWTPLLAASAMGYPEIAKLLLEAGANPDIGNVHGITPLMYGAHYGNVDICKVLLEYQAELDLQDVYGITALIMAANHGYYSIAELLIQGGADTTIRTRNGKTALDVAYATKHGSIAKILRQAYRRTHTAV